MIQVRKARDAEESLDALRPIAQYFGSDPARWASRVTTFVPPDRLLTAREDARVVGGAGSFPFDFTVPGGTLPTAGVTVVGVEPTHRRRGVLRALMRAQLEDVHARGEPLAALWASESTIYRRFGYGVASLAGEIAVPTAHSAFALPFERRGRTRILGPDEARAVVPEIYDRARLAIPGTFARPPEWWEHRTFDDPEWRRQGGGELRTVVVELDGRAEAYALYRHHLSFADGSSTSKLEVIEALGVGPEADRELWRFLLDVDWIETVTASLVQPDHPLFLLLADFRRAGYRVGDGVWVRLVDVGAALCGRAYAGGGAVVVGVTDEFCPWNEGSWRLEDGEARRTDDEPDLRLEAAELGSVFLGGFTFSQLLRAGRIAEAVDGAATRADALFRTNRAPWCPEIF